MARSGWKEYFTFTRKERTGVIVLLGLITIIYAFPEFLPENQPVKLYYNRDSLQQSSAPKFTGDESSSGTEKMVDDDKVLKAIALARFPFDPNVLDEPGWKRLGVSPRTIRTIMNFRSKGGKFREPEDLRKIYGLHKTVCDQLIPFVRIQAGSTGGLGRSGFPSNASNRTGYQSDASIRSGDPSDASNRSGYSSDVSKKDIYARRTDSNHLVTSYKPRKATSQAIDINLSDSASWEQLPAIGSKLASRIILFRERLGGFYNVRQVVETFGISDSAYNVIVPYLQYSETPLNMININVITTSELAKHPYVRWNVAQAIVNYRNQHGPFRDINDLKSVTTVTRELFEKLSPYLSIK